MFNCLFAQIVYQPITWQKLNKYRQLDVLKTAEVQNDCTWYGYWSVSISQLLVDWDFHNPPSLGFTENVSNEQYYTVSGICVAENALTVALTKCLDTQGCCLFDVPNAFCLPLWVDWQEPAGSAVVLSNNTGMLLHFYHYFLTCDSISIMLVAPNSSSS